MEELRRYSDGMEVELPGFTDGESFCVRLRRPSMMLLAQEGKIPNSLLSTATELFQQGRTGEKASLKDMGEIFRIVAQAALAAPTYRELEEAGIHLTDSQLLTIYNYSQTGVDSLRRFRERKNASVSADHGKDV